MVHDELKQLKNWMYCNEEKNAPADMNGKIVSYTNKNNWVPWSIKTKIFILDQNYTAIDFDMCLDENGNIYSWAREFIDPFLNAGFYVEYSRSKRGLHVIAKGGFEGNISIKMNQIHQRFKDLPPKSGIEIFTKHAITMTGNIYKNNMPVDIAGINDNFKVLHKYLSELKNRNVKKMDKYNNSDDLFNYVKSSISLKQVFDYYGVEYNTRKNISCPLPGHNDEKPSFHVDDSKDLFICYAGCGGGSVIDFVMKMENLNSLDATRLIAERHNLEVELTEFKAKTAEEKIKIINNIYISEILKQGAILPEGMNDLPWILEDENEKTGKIKVSVNTGYLAAFLRENVNFIFVRESGLDGIIRYVYKKGVYALSSDYDFKGLIKTYIPESLLKMGMVNEVKENLYSDDKYYSFLDINPEKYINFKDGLLNIDTWKLEPHTPNILSTIQLPIIYSDLKKYSDTNYFDNYINYLVDNNNEKKKTILQFMGVALSNIYGHRTKKSLFMVGPHNTGKSKIKELLSELVGRNNTSNVELSDLEERFGTSAIYNKRVVGSDDMSFMKLKELKLFKRITGGAGIEYEFKFQGKFTAPWTGVLWFCCNELPKFGGDKGDGVYTRIAIIECNKTPVAVKDQNKKLLECMLKEKNYIVYLALEALKQVINNNYNYDLPAESLKALENYKIDNDSFATFIKECCVKRPEGKKIDDCSKAKIFKVYNAWCKDNNNGYHYTKAECSRYLEKKGLDKIIKTDGIIYYTDFTLSIETKKEYIGAYGYDTI